MRLFLAAPLPPGIRTQLTAWQDLLAQSVDNAKWVKGENLHLTLKFLGEVNPAKIQVLTTATAAALGEFSQFTFNISGIGVFPYLQRARILWAGVKDDKRCLQRLQRDLEQCLVKLGFPCETKPFTPHLTLGRLRRPTPVSLPIVPEIQEAVKVDSVVLYESILTPSGPQYRPLSTFNLL
ncbi:MAG: RNA 2',3'-cyclic phosphodiesterase [bacterium]|jgi:2'-5' RNA ligase